MKLFLMSVFRLSCQFAKLGEGLKSPHIGHWAQSNLETVEGLLGALFHQTELVALSTVNRCEIHAL